MTPQQMTAAANALVTATQNAAVSSGQNIEANAAQLAPGLATGSAAPGGYRYAANVAPVVPVLASQFVTTAKQGAFRGAVRDAMNNAQVTYDAAKSGYEARQRKFQQDQAQRARERQAEEDARYAAAAAASAAPGYGVGGVDVVASSGAPTMKQRSDGGFNFTDANGRPISAATYAKLMGVNFAQLVGGMAKAGDKGAAAVLRGPGLVRSANPGAYQALTWS